MAANKNIKFTWDQVEDADGYNIYIKKSDESYNKENESLLTQEEFVKIFVPENNNETYSIYVEAIKGDKVSYPSGRVEIDIPGDFLYAQDFQAYDGAKRDTWIEDGNIISDPVVVRIDWETNTPAEKYVSLKYKPTINGTERLNHPFAPFLFDPQQAVELEYDLFFETIWSFDTNGEDPQNPLYPTGFPYQTGKLHGLAPETNVIVDGADGAINNQGWSLRINWVRNTKSHNLDPSDEPGYTDLFDDNKWDQTNTKPTFGIYVYDQDAPADGNGGINGVHYPILENHVQNGFTGIERNTWYTLKLLAQVNDANKNNGYCRLQVYDKASGLLLGERYVDNLNLRAVDTNDSRINTFFFSTFFGGGDIKFAPPYTIDAEGQIDIVQKEFVDGDGNIVDASETQDVHNGLFARNDNYNVSIVDYFEEPAVVFAEFDASTDESTIRLDYSDWASVDEIEYYIEDGEYDQSGWTTYAGTVVTVVNQREITLSSQILATNIAFRLKIGDRYTAITDFIPYEEKIPRVNILINELSEGDNLSPGDNETYTLTLTGDTADIDHVEYTFGDSVVQTVNSAPWSITYLHTDIASLGDYPVSVKAYTSGNFLLGEQSLTLQMVSNISMAITGINDPVNLDNPVQFTATITDNGFLTTPATTSFRIYDVDGSDDRIIPELYSEAITVNILTDTYQTGDISTFTDRHELRFRLSGEHTHMIGTHLFDDVSLLRELQSSPTINSFTANGETNQISLSWTKDDNNSAVTSIEYNIDGGTWIDAGIMSDSGSINITEESPGVALQNQQYTIGLRVTNAIGSTTSFDTATPSFIPEITTLSASFSDESIEFTYAIEENGIAVTDIEYRVYEEVSGNDLVPPTSLGTTLTDTVTISPQVPSNGIEYAIFIKVTYSGGSISDLIKGTPSGLPVITSFSTESIRQTSFDINYVIDNNGSSFISATYVLDAQAPVALTSSPQTISGLSPNTSYNIKIVLENDNGTTQSSVLTVQTSNLVNIPDTNLINYVDPDQVIATGSDVDIIADPVFGDDFVPEIGNKAQLASNAYEGNDAIRFSGNQPYVNTGQQTSQFTDEISIYMVSSTNGAQQSSVIHSSPFNITNSLNIHLPYTTASDDLLAFDFGDRDTGDGRLIEPWQSNFGTVYFWEFKVKANVMEVYRNSSLLFSKQLSESVTFTSEVFKLASRLSVAGDYFSGDIFFLATYNIYHTRESTERSNIISYINTRFNNIAVPTPIIYQTSVGSTSADIFWRYIPGKASFTATPLDGGATITPSVTDTGNSPITNWLYKVETDDWASSGSTGAFTITGLTNDVEVSIKIKAVNDIGEGFESDAVLVTPAVSSHPEATGGTVTDIDVGGIPYRVHRFTGNGTFAITVAGEFEYLIVAGGGAGGGRNGGGGGAGGVISDTQNISNGSYAVSVGSGGSNNGARNGGNGGQNSSFNSQTAIGGGGGHGADSAGTPVDGGSGGGGSRSTYDGNYLGGSGTAGQGFDGGAGVNNDDGGGGGGATSVGANGAGSGITAGGTGLTSSITGSSYVYGTGGDGNSSGANGSNYGDGGDGTSGTEEIPGNGQDGVVIIRYKLV